MIVTAVPSLDELATDPSKAAGLPPEVARALTLRCAAVLTALAAVRPAATNGSGRDPSAEDRLLKPEEAAAILGVTPRWLYRHAAHLPFTRRLSRKCLRFSDAGLRRWQAAKRP